MLNTVIKGTRTIEEYKMVRDAMEGLTKMYSEMHMQACDEWRDGAPVKTWYDSDGNYYGSLEDIEDAMVNENGVTDQDGNKYYWTAPHDASEEVTDPYDLYSWDPGTNSYIPFQAAESDCSPIGRGNGWYYYDEDSGEYVPW